MIAATEVRLYDRGDVPWIGALLDLVVAHLGKPWRLLLERIEHAEIDAHPARISTVVRALRRTLGGRAQRAKVARHARSLVLGHPALDRDARDARLAAAGILLDLPAIEIESLLWADLALEQPVVLPSGRPEALALIASANLERIQRAVRRARSLQIRVWDHAHGLVRTVARYGLVAHASRGPDGETVLDVTGPLALFHATTIYGRALAQLVPLLAEQPQFTLDVLCELDGIERILHVEPPLLLPDAPVRRRAPSVADLLAKDLFAAGHLVEREPEPLLSGSDLVFPDLAITPVGTHDRWLVEVVGFSTAEYLVHKLVCADEDRAAEAFNNSHVIRFRRRIAIGSVLERAGPIAR